MGVTTIITCEHPAGEIRVTARSPKGFILRCGRCQGSTLAVQVPVRPLRSHESDLLVALARESEWNRDARRS
jgi:hypothetical protein